jgi:hypothetical protein
MQVSKTLVHFIRLVALKSLHMPPMSTVEDTILPQSTERRGLLARYMHAMYMHTDRFLYGELPLKLILLIKTKLTSDCGGVRLQGIEASVTAMSC